MFVRGTHTTAGSIGEIIKGLLESKGWTQREISERMNIAEKQLIRLLDGETS